MYSPTHCTVKNNPKFNITVVANDAREGKLAEYHCSIWTLANYGKLSSTTDCPILPLLSSDNDLVVQFPQVRDSWPPKAVGWYVKIRRSSKHSHSAELLP